MKQILSAPTAINLEITDGCNLKCRHCYNFWREEGSKTFSMDKGMIDRLTDMFAEAGIFHVVFSGGEPFSKFDILEYGIKKMLGRGMSVSCNTNLIFASDDKLRRLFDAGLDHILTSLNSYEPETNDYLVERKGAFNKIIKGIELAIRNKIRVSVNMIVSQKNIRHIYETGKLCHSLGCQKIFGTRVVPSVNLPTAFNTAFNMTKKDALYILEELVRVKQDTGIMIGTLVSYPLCLLSDLEKYSDFVGRGCPAQSGHVIGINANGETHACVHESQSYGNIFKSGIYEIYENMKPWHDKSYRYNGCEGCDYLEVCESGCRLCARAYFGSLDKHDQLMENKNNFIKPYKIVYDPLFYNKISEGLKFYVPKRLRFRKERGFYLVNIRWANTIVADNGVAEFLEKYRDSGEEFDINDFGKDKKELLARLYYKDAVESKYVTHEDLRTKMGLSVDPSAIPNGC